jgi:hypothetical protein
MNNRKRLRQYADGNLANERLNHYCCPCTRLHFMTPSTQQMLLPLLLLGLLCPGVVQCHGG